MIFLISASQVTGITGMSHHAWQELNLEKVVGKVLASKKVGTGVFFFFGGTGF
jgi:hypothetical protein